MKFLRAILWILWVVFWYMVVFWLGFTIMTAILKGKKK